MLKKTLIVLSLFSISAYSSSVIAEEECECPKLTCGETPEMGCLEGNVAKCGNGCFESKVYLPSGGTPQVIHEDELEKKVNSSYPDWYRGCAANGLADEDSHHYYYTLIGPDLDKQIPAGIHAENIFCGTYYMKPDKTYPAHNHPSREFYYIIDGEARWYAGDKEFDVRAGSFIMHPPYTSHGWTNTSKTQWLRAFYCWWAESTDPANVFEFGGRLTNPCLSQSPKTVQANTTGLSQCDSSPSVTLFDTADTVVTGILSIPWTLKGAYVFKNTHLFLDFVNKTWQMIEETVDEPSRAGLLREKFNMGCPDVASWDNNSLTIPWVLADSITVYKNTVLKLDEDGTLQVLEAIQRENLNALEEAKKGCL